MSEWISVKDRLPETEKTVLVCAEAKSIMGKTFRVIAMAFYTNGKMSSEDSAYCWDLDNIEMKYDEDCDAHIIPEGWWESVQYADEFAAISDVVTHWMPLPDRPEERTI